MGKKVKVKRAKGAPAKGKTDYDRLNKITEQEIEKNAESDPDSLPLSDEEMKGFKRVAKKK